MSMWMARGCVPGAPVNHAVLELPRIGRLLLRNAEVDPCKETYVGAR
jgi:hypothetical protein